MNSFLLSRKGFLNTKMAAGGANMSSRATSLALEREEAEVYNRILQ